MVSIGMLLPLNGTCDLLLGQDNTSNFSKRIVMQVKRNNFIDMSLGKTVHMRMKLDVGLRDIYPILVMFKVSFKLVSHNLSMLFI